LGVNFPNVLYTLYFDNRLQQTLGCQFFLVFVIVAFVVVLALVVFVDYVFVVVVVALLLLSSSSLFM
jgi:hypothetical protein